MSGTGVNPLWSAPYCPPPAERGEVPEGQGEVPEGRRGAEQCRTCVWHFYGGRGKPVDRCRRHRNEPISPLAPACPAYTASLDCLTCGACCREAYHAVEVAPRDPFLRLHPELVELDENRGGAEGPRRVVSRVPTPTGTRCVCLGTDYRCSVYADRPRTCREFEQGSVNCVEARRRVGLTP